MLTSRTRSCAPQEVVNFIISRWGRNFSSDRLVFRERRDELTPVEQLALLKGSIQEQGLGECMRIFNYREAWHEYYTPNYLIWYAPSIEELYPDDWRKF